MIYLKSSGTDKSVVKVGVQKEVFFKINSISKFLSFTVTLLYIFILGGTVWQVLEYQGTRDMLILARETGQVVSGDMVDVQNDATA